MYRRHRMYKIQDFFWSFKRLGDAWVSALLVCQVCVWYVLLSPFQVAIKVTRLATQLKQLRQSVSAWSLDKAVNLVVCLDSCLKHWLNSTQQLKQLRCSKASVLKLIPGRIVTLSATVSYVYETRISQIKVVLNYVHLN